MTWHAEPDTLAAYHRGDAPEAVVASIEAHLLACADCRSAYAHEAQDQADWLEAIWSDVVDTLDAPRASWAERLMHRVGVAPHTARVLAATPMLRLSWALSILIAAVAALTLASSDQAGLFLQLLAAPLLPPLGVAVAYGAGIDPAYELGAATPLHGLRLVVLRTVAVTSVTLGAGLATSAFLPWSWTAFAWLLPALGLGLLTLALCTFTPSARKVAAVVDVAWAIGIVIAQEPRQPGIEGVGLTTQLAFAAMAVLAAGVIRMRARA
jgi:hypothetical protein